MTLYFSFLNMGFPEIATILIVALLLLGPQKLPEFARWLGRMMHDLKRTTHEVREAINFEIEREEMERLRKEFSDQLLDPSAELKKAANTWMDEITSPPAPSPDLPTSTQTTAPDALQSLGILASASSSSLDAPQSSLSDENHPVVDENSGHHTTAQEVASPQLATIPLAVESIMPPSDSVARGRRIHTPFSEQDTDQPVSLPSPEVVPEVMVETPQTTHTTSLLKNTMTPAVEAAGTQHPPGLTEDGKPTT